MRGHRPPLPNPQPDPGPLPDPTPVPSPEPTPIPEPLPPQFVGDERLHETVPDTARVEPREIGQESLLCDVNRHDGAPPLARVCMKSGEHPCSLAGALRLGLVLVIASTIFAACQPRKPTPLVSHGGFVPANFTMLSTHRWGETGPSNDTGATRGARRAGWNKPSGQAV